MGASKVTISDIAAAAGVSKATVSRFINGKLDLISAPTRARIKKAISTTGYQPSTAARQLSLGENEAAVPSFIGLIMHDCENPAMLPLVQQCFNSAKHNGQNVFVAFMNSTDNLDTIAKKLFAKGASAIFYACLESDEPKLLRLCE